MLRPLVLTLFLAAPASAADLLALQQLLQNGSCQGCALQDADLVHAELKGAQLRGSNLRGANLGRAQLQGADLRQSDLREAVLQGANLRGADLRGANLSGADLREADLSFTNLYGASLRGADLRGSRLFGTDLRGADLSGAQLDVGALEQSHWQGARGVADGILNHADLHNSGVDAAQAGDWQEAERLFAAAILRKPSEPLSWVARGLSRGEQGKNDLAAKDLAHAGRLFAEQGDAVAEEISRSSIRREHLARVGESAAAAIP